MLDAMDTTEKKLLAPERAEPERSGGEANGGANNRAADQPVPDPEVLARPKRRRFTAAYKARQLMQTSQIPTSWMSDCSPCISIHSNPCVISSDRSCSSSNT